MNVNRNEAMFDNPNVYIKIECLVVCYPEELIFYSFLAWITTFVNSSFKNPCNCFMTVF
jgi:hypothetical protein